MNPLTSASTPAEVRQHIDAVYVRLGYQLGWRFLMCPESMIPFARLILVGLNPSGDRVHGPPWSQELGNAYQIEEWDGAERGQDRLQVQVGRMIELAGMTFDDVLSAQFVPFRSPVWAALRHQSEALVFACEIWRWLLPRTRPQTIVCLGKQHVGPSIAGLTNAVFDKSFKIGWGEQSADRYRLPNGGKLISMPHLARFSVFGRTASQTALRDLFEV